MRVRLIVAWIGAAWALSGCGGGGGAPTGDLCATGQVVSSFVYRTSWASDDPTLGVSQLVTLFDGNRNAVTSRVLNRGGQTIVSFDNIASGTYTMQAELRSRADGLGSTIGSVRAIVDVCGVDRATNSFTTVAGATVTGVRVWPATAKVRQHESRAFAATALSVRGEGVFTGQNEFTWEVLGGIGQVDTNGLFLATQPGPGAVRATHDPTGRIGSATLTVDPFVATRAKWTILVFMGAANDLYPFSTMNVNQMERAADNPDVRFVLQWKQSRAAFPGSSFDGTRRYLVTPDHSPAIASRLIQDLGRTVDMGSPEALGDFIEWGKRLYPADRYGLIVWSHGNGWRRSFSDNQPSRAVSFDDETGNAIQIWELGQALGTARFDFLAWDASLMQMLEVAYEVRGNADYVIGSQESPPGEGYPYDVVFAPFRDTPDLSTRELSTSFVDGMLNHPAYANRKITQSVLDTTKLDALAGAVDRLGAALFGARTQLLAAVPAVRDQAQSYSPTTLRIYRDLIHVCTLLEGRPDVPHNVKDAAQAVRVAAREAIVWEGSNAHSPNSEGISIDFSSGARFSTSQTDYRLLQLARDTRWDEWLMVAP